jgi:hypothetical protein
MAVSQRPLSAAASTEAATTVGWKDLPSWYLVSDRDNAIPPACERFMAQRMNAVTETVDGSHVAFIAKPEVASGLSSSRSQPSESISLHQLARDLSHTLMKIEGVLDISMFTQSTAAFIELASRRADYK